MNLAEIAPQHIRDIAPYQPGKPTSELARELGLNEADIIKLASNENPLGVSPKAMVAMQAALPQLALYPDGNGYGLKDVISKKLKCGTSDGPELASRNNRSFRHIGQQNCAIPNPRTGPNADANGGCHPHAHQRAVTHAHMPGQKRSRRDMGVGANLTVV